MRKWIALFCVSFTLYADPIEEVKAKVAQVTPNLYGWCTKEKAMHFVDLVFEVEPELCVEIGVFGGRSLFPVAASLKALDHGMVIAIDPWNKEEVVRYFDPTKDQAHIDWWSRLNYEQIYNSFLGMLVQYQLEDYVITLRTTSELASYAIGDIDILHIDGNHNEQVSNQDIQLYLPKVRQGGYIWLTDTLWSDLQSSVDLLFEACDVVKVIDGGNAILFRKR